MEAFQQVMARRPKITRHIVETENLRIEDRIDQIIQLFNSAPGFFLKTFLKTSMNDPVDFNFMSLLEMVKIRLITLIQLEHLGPIHCTVHEDFQENQIWYELQEKKNPRNGWSASSELTSSSSSALNDLNRLERSACFKG